MIRLYEDFADAGLLILGLNVRDGPAEVETFTAEHDIPFPMFLDRDNSPALFEWPASKSPFPMLLLVDAEGIVRALRRGYVDAEIEALVTELLR